MRNKELVDLINRFELDAAPVSYESSGSGHINRTYLVASASGRRYILQRINDHVFCDVPALMENIAAVTRFLNRQTDDPRRVLTLIPTVSGDSFTRSGDGGYWRMFAYVENSICLQQPDTPEDFYQSAIAFGTFQQQLAAFPVATLHETIANFHNTPDRYRQLHEAVEKDVCGRAASAAREIDFACARESEAGALVREQSMGRLPLRVTHNDTKLNNVLLDRDTRKALCVIDLDTVMPGLSLYDFGDAIRFGAAAAAEDVPDPAEMFLRLDLYRVFTRGFVQACPDLTANERALLPVGAKLMTLECGVRFLTDYLDGDRYFSIHREGHNLDRCRAQFALAADMERRWADMETIAAEEAAVRT